MSTATRVPLAQASGVADQLLTVLGLGCHRIAIAGSIRRQRPDVGDIELVAVPRVHTLHVADGLFGEREVTVDELQVVIDTLLMDGTLTSHPTHPARGPKYSKLIHVTSGLQVDLFCAKPDGSNFGLIYLIRTGPAAFSQYLVTEAKARGHHVAAGELHVGPGSRDPRGEWHPPLGCPERCSVIQTPEERDVFVALRMAEIPPERRA